MEKDTSRRPRFRSVPPSGGAANEPPPEAARALVAALASYLSSSRNKADARKAINTWCRDAVNAGLQPERLIIDFKQILLGLQPAQQSLDVEQRMADQQEMIAMCIEEYYR